MIRVTSRTQLDRHLQPDLAEKCWRDQGCGVVQSVVVAAVIDPAGRVGCPRSHGITRPAVAEVTYGGSG
jgi:hypothetical protein